MLFLNEISLRQICTLLSWSCVDGPHHGSQRSPLARLRPSLPQDQRQRRQEQALPPGQGPELSRAGPQGEGETLGSSWCRLQGSLPLTCCQTGAVSLQLPPVSLQLRASRTPKTPVQVRTLIQLSKLTFLLMDLTRMDLTLISLIKWTVSQV